MHDNLVGMIERVYDGSMVNLEFEDMTTGWCKSDSACIILLYFCRCM